MPQDEFRWQNLPGWLLRALCDHWGERADDPVATLTDWYGDQPGDRFVQESWPVLRESWLARAARARVSVIEQLWDLGVGSAGRFPEEPAAQMSFLRSCNNARRLREVVLEELIRAGGVDPTSGASQTEGSSTVDPNERQDSPRTRQDRGEGQAQLPRVLSPSELSLPQLESRLWGAANALRGPVDPADFKTYVFPTLFWKWISDTWDSEHAKAVEEFGPDVSAEVEADYHRFALPEGTHWREVTTRTANLGSGIGKALGRIEQANPSRLAGIFGDAAWGNKERLPEASLVALVNAFNGLQLHPDRVSHDMLGQAYEYLLKNFADESGKKAGEFFTPRKWSG